MTLSIRTLADQAHKKGINYKISETDLSDNTIEIEEDLGIFHTFYENDLGRVVYYGRFNLDTMKKINSIKQEIKILKLLNLK